ncbi:hypothetical protein FE257_002440 [Aspergillus nanangensis]|uniref:Nucleoporin NUP37 n=1 Tax=Aspergillus nanangensis TaxID=2582783 RepID=A0AAD4GVT3_ASPNN|nr:hypothetical protein FE257_002440 [Aspergillus nanangensis]
MPSIPSRPLVRPRDGGLQLSYRFPHRVYSAKGYPVLAPNGSSIIVYGYEGGLKVTWRGGRHFAAGHPQPPNDTTPHKPKFTNGGDDAIMIIDSDEEQATEPPKKPEPIYHYEDEEPEVDPTYPYEDVLRQLDIPLGSRVLQLAVPRIAPETARSSLDPFPPALTEVMIIAAVCADHSTRIVTLPLAPPHPSQHATSIRTFSISGGVSHQEIPRGVSISFTYQENESQEDLDMSQNTSPTSGSSRWELLVATHSAESAGLLILHRIPIADETDSYRLYDNEIETKRRYLPSPATNITFNPAPFPSPRHSTLLVSYHDGCVKIYSCFYKRPIKASRRASSSQTGLEMSEPEGKWLISLYPGFEPSPSGLAKRKSVIHAEWVLGGQAVMVLMADGEWGVWDVEGAGPGTTKGPLERQSSVQGVSGGSLTTFSVSGRILSPLPERNRSESSGAAVEQRPKFAPLTPSTKRIREDTLFKGAPVGSTSPSLCGEISVYQTNSYRDALPDESILFRHGNQSAVIPSLLSLWRNAVKSSGTFDASNRCRVSAIQDITLMGEQLKGIGHLPAAFRHARESEGQNFDILLTAEHRFLVLAPRLTEPEEPPLSRHSVSEGPHTDADQIMLRRGELDVNGMDRLLSGMASANQSLRMGSPIKRARIFS